MACLLRASDGGSVSPNCTVSALNGVLPPSQQGLPSADARPMSSWGTPAVAAIPAAVHVHSAPGFRTSTAGTAAGALADTSERVRSHTAASAEAAASGDLGTGDTRTLPVLGHRRVEANLPHALSFVFCHQ
jgi:hypothetical protein